MRSNTIEEELTLFCQNIAWLRNRNKLTMRQMVCILKISTYSLRLIEQRIIPQRLSINVFFNASVYFGIPSVKLLTDQLDKKQVSFPIQ